MSRPPPRWSQPTEIVQKIANLKKDKAAKRPRLPGKGLLYLKKTNPGLRPDENLRITATRILKAERDERIDITLALTPVKQYMAGFTRPSDLRTSRWFPGGTYIVEGRTYESPSNHAYQPHTVFLLESRYNIRYGPGRVEAPEYIYGVCQEQDLPAVLRNYNSERAPLNILETMDNARWPWGPQQTPHPRAKWWTKAVELEEAKEYILDIQPEPVDGLNPMHSRPHTSLPLPSDFSPTASSARTFTSSAQQTTAAAECVLEEGDITEDTTTETTSRQGKVTPTDSPIGQLKSLNLDHSKRRLHTTASSRAQEIEWDFAKARDLMPHASFIPRKEYLPTLSETPFWRPLLTLTLSTRPLALTLLRLAKGLPTGRPFHADIAFPDRKCRSSFPLRMRALRVKRIQDLAIELAQVLAGARGGVVGIRFDTDSIGRGIGGEALADPIPPAQRVIAVSVGRFFRFAEEFKEMLRARGQEEVPGVGQGEFSPFEIYDLDDFGTRHSTETGEVVLWSVRQETIEDTWAREPWHVEYCTLLNAIKLYKRCAQEVTSIGQAKKFTPKTKSAPMASSQEEDDDEIHLTEEEEDENDSATLPTLRPPIILIRDSEDAFKELMQDLTSNIVDENTPLTALDSAPNFVLCRSDKTPVLGPHDPVTGGISTEGMTRVVPTHIAKRLVQQRYYMWCIAKKKEIAAITAARSRAVDYPDKPRRIY